MITVLITVVAADVIGTSLLYILFYSCGHLVLQKWPSLMSRSKLASLTATISKKHLWGIYLGRHMPFLRGYTAVAAGLLHIPPRLFLPAVLLSAMTWSGGYVVAGRLLGQKYVEAGFTLEPGWALLAGIACLGVVAFLGRRMHRRLTRNSLHMQ